MTTTSLYASSTGADARLRALDVLANNLANSATTGFRADTPVFREVLAASLPGSVSRDPVDGLVIFSGSGSHSTRHAPGPFNATGAPLDAAISGPGFFELQTPEGPRFTRAGHFNLDPSGVLVSAEGHPVVGEGGPIAITTAQARIESDGQIVDGQGRSLGRLALQVFEDPNELRKEGLNTFSAPELARRSPAEGQRLIPGGLEGSNVQPMQELAQLVVIQRAFDASMQALQADDEASRRLNQEVTS